MNIPQRNSDEWVVDFDSDDDFGDEDYVPGESNIEQKIEVMVGLDDSNDDDDKELFREVAASVASQALTVIPLSSAVASDHLAYLVEVSVYQSKDRQVWTTALPRSGRPR